MQYYINYWNTLIAKRLIATYRHGSVVAFELDSRSRSCMMQDILAASKTPCIIQLLLRESGSKATTDPWNTLLEHCTIVLEYRVAL